MSSKEIEERKVSTINKILPTLKSIRKDNEETEGYVLAFVNKSFTPYGISFVEGTPEEKVNYNLSTEIKGEKFISAIKWKYNNSFWVFEGEYKSTEYCVLKA